MSDRDEREPMTAAVVLVGEMNPYGVEKRFALYCEPPNSAGGRMQRLVCGLSRRNYLSLRRTNLCSVKWSDTRAREAAALVKRNLTVEAINWKGPVMPTWKIVMLGRKVAKAFGMGDLPPFMVRMYSSEFAFLSLPHPSGLCRVWNEPGSFERARGVLRRLAPDLPWGEV